MKNFEILFAAVERELREMAANREAVANEDAVAGDAVEAAEGAVANDVVVADAGEPADVDMFVIEDSDNDSVIEGVRNSSECKVVPMEANIEILSDDSDDCILVQTDTVTSVVNTSNQNKYMYYFVIKSVTRLTKKVKVSDEDMKKCFLYACKIWNAILKHYPNVKMKKKKEFFLELMTSYTRTNFLSLPEPPASEIPPPTRRRGSSPKNTTNTGPDVPIQHDTDFVHQIVTPVSMAEERNQSITSTLQPNTEDLHGLLINLSYYTPLDFVGALSNDPQYQHRGTRNPTLNQQIYSQLMTNNGNHTSSTAESNATQQTQQQLVPFHCFFPVIPCSSQSSHDTASNSICQEEQPQPPSPPLRGRGSRGGRGSRAKRGPGRPRGSRGGRGRSTRQTESPPVAETFFYSGHSAHPRYYVNPTGYHRQRPVSIVRPTQSRQYTPFVTTFTTPCRYPMQPQVVSNTANQCTKHLPPNFTEPRIPYQDHPLYAGRSSTQFQPQYCYPATGPNMPYPFQPPFDAKSYTSFHIQQRFSSNARNSMNSVTYQPPTGHNRDPRIQQVLSNTTTTTTVYAYDSLASARINANLRPQQQEQVSFGGAPTIYPYQSMPSMESNRNHHHHHHLQYQQQRMPSDVNSFVSSCQWQSSFTSGTNSGVMSQQQSISTRTTNSDTYRITPMQRSNASIHSQEQQISNIATNSAIPSRESTPAIESTNTEHQQHYQQTRLRLLQEEQERRRRANIASNPLYETNQRGLQAMSDHINTRLQNTNSRRGNPFEDINFEPRAANTPRQLAHVSLYTDSYQVFPDTTQAPNTPQTNPNCWW